MSATTTLTGKIEVQATINVKAKTADGVTNDQWRIGTPLVPAWSISFTDGTGANQAQKHYHKLHTLNPSDTVALDLQALVQERNGGDVTISLSKVKSLEIRIRSAVTGNKLTVGNAASNIWSAPLSISTATFDVKTGILWPNEIDGWTVDGTHKSLKFNNTGTGTISFDVSIIGQ